MVILLYSIVTFIVVETVINEALKFGRLNLLSIFKKIIHIFIFLYFLLLVLSKILLAEILAP